MVTGASAGPKVKSAELTGGKYESELGARVGSATIAEQLFVYACESNVGVKTGTIGNVGEMPVSDDAHAPRTKSVVIDKNKIIKIRFIMMKYVFL